MEENRKGPGVFYAVMGVATLVVAIIGATFAFFTASATVSGDDVEGTTATGSTASVTVARVNPIAGALTTERMVPLRDDRLASAVENKCVDSNGYVACQIYSVTVKNTGLVEDNADTIYVKTYLDLDVETAGLVNMQWQVMESATALGEGTPVTNHTVVNGTSLGEQVALDAEEEEVYYVMVWLHDTEGNQTTDDAGKTFGGAFTSFITNADGEKIGDLTATFTTGA